MRKVILSLVLGVAALAGTLLTPAHANAQWRGGYYYTPYYAYSYPAYSSYYVAPAYSSTYVAPAYSSTYVAPAAYSSSYYNPSISYSYSPAVTATYVAPAYYYPPSYGIYYAGGWGRRGWWR